MVFVEVRVDLGFRSPLQKQLTVPPRLVIVGILLIHHFFFSFFHFLLDDFNFGLLGFLEVVWFLWK